MRFLGVMTTTPWTQANDRFDSTINRPPRLCPPRCAFTFNPIVHSHTVIIISKDNTQWIYPILLPPRVPHSPSDALFIPSLAFPSVYVLCVCLSVSKFAVCISPLRVLVLDLPYRVLSCTSRFVFFLSPPSTSFLHFCPPSRHTLLVRPLYNLGTVLRRLNISFHYFPSPCPHSLGDGLGYVAFS